MKKISMSLALCSLCSSFAIAQANLPDPYSAPPSSSNFYYTNMGQIVDENGTLHPEIKYYTEHTYPEVYLADDKISFVATKSADTNIVGDVDSIGRIDLQFLCNKGAKSQISEKPTAFLPCGTIATFEPSQDHLNYYLPQCPNGITNVPGYARVVYENAFPDIDVHFYSNATAMKVYFVIKPGGNPADIDLLFTGQDSIGSLGSSLAMYFGPWKLQFPQAIAYQINPNNSTTVMGWLPTWVHNGSGEVTLSSIGSYNTSEDLVIAVGGPITQPTAGSNLEWATYYGDDGLQCCSHITTNDNAILYNVIGEGGGVFPSLQGSQPQNNGGLDWYVSKFNNDGSRAWATYYGGGDSEWPTAIKESLPGSTGSGAIWVAGYTFSYGIDLGQAGGFQQTGNAGILNQPLHDGLIASFNKSDGTLIYGTYFGGNGSEDEIYNMDIKDNKLYVVGGTKGNTQYVNNCSVQTSGGFPLCSGTGNSFFQGTKQSPNDEEGFIAQFSMNSSSNSLNSLDWCTLFGGAAGGGIGATGDDYIFTVKKVNNQFENALYIGGETSSPVNTGNFTSPMTSHNNAYFPLCNPGNNAFFQTNYTQSQPQAFLARFSSDNQLTWCTLFGQSNGGFRTIAFNSQHQLYAVEDGVSQSYAANTSNLPNSQGEFPVYSNGTSYNYTSSSSGNLVCRFNSDLSLGWSTLLPGLNGTEKGMIMPQVDLGIDPLDRIFVSTSSLPGSLPVFNVSGAYWQPNNASTNASDFEKFDNYIMTFDDQEQPIWFTFFGGAYPSSTYNSNKNSSDQISGIALSSGDYLFLTGETHCPNSPYTQCPPGAYCDQTYNPGEDAFIARMGLTNLPTQGTGIAQQTKNKGNELIVFPNPTDNVLIVQYNNRQATNHTANLKIVNVSGKVISSTVLSLKPGNNLFQLNMEGIASGMYFLKIEQDSETSTVKFVKK